MTVLPSVGPPQMAEKNLSARLDALADLTRIGRDREGTDGFAAELLDEELLRFIELLDEAGPVDPVAAVRLYQAEYSLEAVR